MAGYREQVEPLARFIKQMSISDLLAAEAQIEQAYARQASRERFPHVGAAGYWLVSTRRIVCRELKGR
jgi:hypothetical protein